MLKIVPHMNMTPSYYHTYIFLYNYHTYIWSNFLFSGTISSYLFGVNNQIINNIVLLYPTTNSIRINRRLFYNFIKRFRMEGKQPPRNMEAIPVHN